MEKMTNRLLNNNYAPGIATYGVDGANGARGVAGTAFYFTTYNLEYGTSNGNEAEKVLVKVNQNKILSSYNDKKNERKYTIGDIIIDGCGYMYSLILQSDGTFGLEYISRLNIDDSSNYFQKLNDRVVVTEKGLDIFDNLDSSALTNINGSVETDSSAYSLRIFSTPNTSSTSGFISLTAQSYGSDEQKYLNIFYDKTTDSFCFKSDSNIVFDVSALMIDGTNSGEASFSEYYKVEPYKDPIGWLHKVFSEASYSVQGNTITIQGVVENYSNIDIVPDFLRLKTESGEIMVAVDKSVDFNSETGELTKEIAGVENLSEQLNFLSIIKGIEIYIKRA